MEPDQLVLQRISASASQMVAARWQTIAGYFGSTVLRQACTFPPEGIIARDPHAPGFAPIQGVEFLAHTTCEINIAGEHALWLAEAAIDAACYRLECQVRQALRGKSARGEQAGVPPALELDMGDRVQCVLLQNSNGSPIRWRITQLVVGEPTARVDLELMLKKVTGDECADGAARRLVQAVTPLVQAAIAATEHRDIPLRVLMDCQQLDGLPIVVAVGIGEEAAPRLRQQVEVLVAELAEAGPTRSTTTVTTVTRRSARARRSRPGPAGLDGGSCPQVDARRASLSWVVVAHCRGTRTTGTTRPT